MVKYQVDHVDQADEMVARQIGAGLDNSVGMESREQLLNNKTKSSVETGQNTLDRYL